MFDPCSDKDLNLPNYIQYSSLIPFELLQYLYIALVYCHLCTFLSLCSMFSNSLLRNLKTGTAKVLRLSTTISPKALMGADQFKTSRKQCPIQVYNSSKEYTERTKKRKRYRNRKPGRICGVLGFPRKTHRPCEYCRSFIGYHLTRPQKLDFP